MKGKGVLFLVMGALALALMAAPVGATTINIVAPGGAWQTIQKPNVDNNQSPYWDNGPTDGGNNNIGFKYFSQTSETTAYYLGTSPESSTNYVTNFFFKDGGANVVLKFELAGYKDTNEFGYYTVSGSNITYNKIFTGTDSPGSPGSTKNVTLPSAFGFYIKADNTTYYYTQSQYNPSSDTQFQHFAVFRSPTFSNVLWIGMEDLPYSVADKDYNDMIVKITWDGGGGNVVPLPGSVLLLGTGLMGLLAVRGFRRTRKK
jgi:hypothetical protein